MDLVVGKMLKKILILNWMDPRNPKAGGQEKYCYEIARRLTNDGYQVTWIASGYRGLEESEYYNGINIVRVGNIYTVFIRAFFKYIEFKSYDFVFLSMNSIPFLAPLHRKRRIIMLHHRIDLGVMRFKAGIMGFVSYFLQEFITPLLYRNDYIITNSNSSKEDFLLLGYKHINTVKLGVDIHDEQLVKKENIIVSPGPVKPWKHHDWAMKAFSYLDEDWTLVIFGSVESEEYAKHLEIISYSLGIKKRVKFLGKISRDKVDEIFSKSKICLVATEKEGWGLVAMEAQSFGCPVVGFDVPGLRDSVINQVTGILVNFGDITSLGEALSSLSNDEIAWKRMSEMAIKRSKLYDWNSCYVDFKNHMQEALEEKA